MTLIMTHINRHGIIHATDSNLTSSDDRNVGQGQKAFEIPFLKAGLTTAGSYSVKGCPMNKWMLSFINNQSKLPGLTLEGFSRNLKDELQELMIAEEKQAGCMIHICGYVEYDGASHVEFWFVRNVYKMDPTTGEYEDIRDLFQISEDFWARDYQSNSLKGIFQNPKYLARQIYVNGLTPGRIGFNVLRKKLDDFLFDIWKTKDWKFRPPNNLLETEMLVKIYMQVITALFVMSDYNAHYIGGDTQTILIPQPTNIVDNN